jgi:hypothetical protein
MHSHNLYHVPKYRTTRFTELVRDIRSKVALPGTEEVADGLATKCQRLIDTSARAWKEEGMLIPSGGGGGGWLCKSPALREAWNSYKDAFQLIELTHWGSVDGVGTAGSYRSPKVCPLTICYRAALIVGQRTTESCPSGDAKRACVDCCPDHCGHGHSRPSRDTIVVYHPVGNPTAPPSPSLSPPGEN